MAFSLRDRLGVKVGLSKVCLGLARTTLCYDVKAIKLSCPQLSFRTFIITYRGILSS